VLGYRNTPAGPWMLQPRMTCSAGSWSPLPGEHGRAVVASVAGHMPVAGPRCSGPEAPSFQAGLAVVSPARNRS
jgi:hypothetical protein